LAALQRVVTAVLCVQLAASPVAEAMRETVTEEAVIELSPGRETVTMRFVTDFSGYKTTWVMPVPARAEVTLGDGKLLDDLNKLSEPDYKDEYTVKIGGDEDVVYFRAKRQTDPYEVRHLDSDNAADWLTQHGYKVTDIPYLAEGWTLVAVTPVRDKAGSSLPLRISFATDTPVYPMRLKKVPSYVDELRLHVLADHRMDAHPLTLRFAGTVGPHNQFLTTFTMPRTGPTGDVRFAQAASDDGYRAALPRQNVIEIPVWLVVLAAVAVLTVLTARALIRRRRRIM
jgi:hypothetical protein